MSAISEEKIRTLIFKYLAESLTAEEAEELNYFRTLHPGVNELISRMQNKEEVINKLQQWDKIDMEKGRAKFLRTIRSANRRR